MRMTKSIFEALCSGQSYLYIVKLYNKTESFYKIGVTSKENVEERFKSFPYDYDIIKVYQHTCTDLIMDLEKHLLSLSDKYVPSKEFGGYSECVSTIEPQADFLKTLNWITNLTEITEYVLKQHRNKIKDRLGTNNFTAIAKDYLTALEKKDKDTILFIEEYDDLFKTARLQFKGNIFNDFSACSYQRKPLEQRLNIQTACNDDKIQQLIISKFRIGQVYSKTKIKKVFEDIYSSASINKTVKATDIKKYFNVKTTTNSKAESCFKILSKINQ